jgi:hypothetical protein
METIDLDTAVSEIQQACEDGGPDSRRSPFFLIVGAGISCPEVPLASTIIEHCKEVAARYNRRSPPARVAMLDEYSHWFGLAYRQARMRQRYLRDLIENRPISLANLRLAHLLSRRKLTNLVVTTNFDDLLSRALRLFGENPAVCDHPSTVGRIDADRPEPQIVHVHGSYLFYDFANLRGEIIGRARANEETSLTVVGLLDSILWTRSPLVVGYAGWEGDVIMSALRRRLRGGQPLAQSIYWFCYDRAAIDELPRWLRNSADVRLVLPDDSVAARPSAGAVNAPADGSANGAPPMALTKVAGPQETTPTLPASVVF